MLQLDNNPTLETRFEQSARPNSVNGILDKFPERDGYVMTVKSTTAKEVKQPRGIAYFHLGGQRYPPVGRYMLREAFRRAYVADASELQPLLTVVA